MRILYLCWEIDEGCIVRVLRWFLIVCSIFVNVIVRDFYLIWFCLMLVMVIEFKRLMVWLRIIDCVCKLLIFVLLLCIYFFVLLSIDDKNLGKFFFMLNFGFMFVMMLVNFFVWKYKVFVF